jgi:hypothetical protein
VRIPTVDAAAASANFAFAANLIQFGRPALQGAFSA